VKKSIIVSLFIIAFSAQCAEELVIPKSLADKRDAREGRRKVRKAKKRAATAALAFLTLSGVSTEGDLHYNPDNSKQAVPSSKKDLEAAMFGTAENNKQNTANEARHKRFRGQKKAGERGKQVRKNANKFGNKDMPHGKR